MPRTNVDQVERQMRRFTDWLRGEMKRKKVTQRKLAEYLDITQQALSLKMRGLSGWQLRDVLNICEYFEVSLEETIA